jgi:hypothetical protein
MDWITQEQAKNAAKVGKIEALEMSLLHHEQGRDADAVELIDAIRDNEFYLGSNLCACCRRYDCDTDDAGDVCLLDENNKCCDGHFKKVDNAFDIMKANPTDTNIKAFQDAESKICEYIADVLAIERANSITKKEEVTYSVGDRFVDSNKEKYILSFVDGMVLVSLKDGWWWPQVEKVKDKRRISEKEFKKIAGLGGFVRYFDYQKGEKCTEHP